MAIGLRSSQTAQAPRTGDHGIRFCRGKDGIRLAYAMHGSGPPLVIVSCWLSHLQHDWQSPVWRHFLDELGAIAQVVRYDERGFGMSDWAIDDFSLEARLRDLEAVIEATGLGRFAMLGVSGGSEVAMAYAAKNTDRLTRLVLYGTVSGEPARFTPERLALEETYRSMIRVGWSKEDPEFRRVFTTRFIPDATEEQLAWFDDLQRMSTSSENAVASRIARQQIDVADELGTITVPTLVLHAVGDRATPFEGAVAVSTRIPGARLVPLESRNHILLADESAWRVFMDEVTAFIEADRRAWATRSAGPGTNVLSTRELDVLRLVARGRANEEIARELTLGVRTVERHLSNIYGKLDLTGPSARAGAVARYLRDEVA